MPRRLQSGGGALGAPVFAEGVQQVLAILSAPVPDVELRHLVHRYERLRLAILDAKQALVEAFVSFGRRIGAQLVAEGIETRSDLATLVELGVDFGQGA